MNHPTTPTPTDLPEALRLADALDCYAHEGMSKAAAELRRLHALRAAAPAVVPYTAQELEDLWHFRERCEIMGVYHTLERPQVIALEEAGLLRLHAPGGKHSITRAGRIALAAPTAPQEGAPAVPDGFILVSVDSPNTGLEYIQGAWSRRNWEAAMRDQKSAADRIRYAEHRSSTTNHPTQAGAESYPPSNRRLVEILANNWRVWPAGQAVEQTSLGDVFCCTKGRSLTFGTHEIASDQDSAVVTKEMWESQMNSVALRARGAVPSGCQRCSGSGEDPEGYFDQSRGPDGDTHDGPCRACDGTGAAAPTCKHGLPVAQAAAVDQGEALTDLKHCYWIMLRECESKADSENDAVLRHQVDGFYRLWNRVTGQELVPVWAARAAKGQEGGDAP